MSNVQRPMSRLPPERTGSGSELATHRRVHDVLNGSCPGLRVYHLDP